jgi:hypothetical protein
MGKLKMKKVVSVVLIAIIVLIATQINVLGFDLNTVINGNSTTNTTQNATTNTTQNTTTPTLNTTNTTGNTASPVLNTSNSTYQNTNLPNTGSNDLGVIFLIIVCAGSALYAYKKIRDYNVK